MFNKIRTSEFYKNVLTLVSGTAIAQAIPVLISPLLTRLYSPSDFGLIALYLAIVNIFVIVATGRYNLAIMLPEDEKEASDLRYLSIYINFLVSIILFLIILFFNHQITSILDNDDISVWLYFIPLSVFIRALFQIYEYYENRRKHYKAISYANVSQTFGTSATRLGMGFMHLGGFGMIVGSIIGAITGSLHIRYLSSKKDIIKYQKPSLDSLKIVAKRFKKFPLFTMPSNGLNTISVQIPVILLTRFFSASIVGFYSFSHRMLSMPMFVIGRSFAQVYFQKASTLRNKKKELANFTFSVYKKLLIIGIIPMSIIGVWGDYIFSFVFGSEWVIAGVYSQFLSIWFLFNFISSPLSQLFSVLEKQQKSLVVNSILLIFRATPLIIGGLLYADSALNVIILYSLVSTIFWIGFCFYLLRMARVSAWKAMMYTFKIIFLLASPIIMLRFILKIPFF
jgi:lipopolysaccharide exporter